MKGTRDAPQCGFSRTAIGLLQDEGVDFTTFDILEDQEVRQGLKKFSNWPTYPQVTAVTYFTPIKNVLVTLLSIRGVCLRFGCGAVRCGERPRILFCGLSIYSGPPFFVWLFFCLHIRCVLVPVCNTWYLVL